MKFISAEEFLEQPKEVQKIFLDWFENNADSYDLVCTDTKIKYISFYGDLEFGEKADYVPLLTEGQLRKFIEDKTGCYFSCEIINPLVNEEGFRFVFEFYSGKEFKYNGKLRKEIYAIDLLQAYWKVAVQIAKEVEE